jgi:TonB family protein
MQWTKALSKLLHPLVGPNKALSQPSSGKAFKGQALGKWIRRLSAASALLISLSWLGYLITTSGSTLYMPWLIALSGASCFWALSMAPAKATTSFSFARIRQDEVVALPDTLSFTYLLFSLTLAFLIFRNPCEQIHPISTRQFIDIKLTSFADYQDHKELLPSTEPKPTLAKRVGSTINTSLPTPSTSKSYQLTMRQPAASAENTTPSSTPRNLAKSPRLKVEKSADPLFVVSQPPQANEKPPQRNVQMASFAEQSKWKTVVTARPTRLASSEPLQIEEVAPMKLMEVTDNDGDAGNEVWQAGGRSSGGKGAHSPLANYLKELHKRLKRAWSPPIGTKTGCTEILFRLQRDGHLVVVKLAVSSGDNEADQSAMNAVARSAPFKPLPDEYLPQYLDLRYKFNYTVDEMKEIPGASLSSIADDKDYLH